MGFEISIKYIAIAVVILIGVFAIQRHGTHRVGRLSGPIMVVWFIAIAVLGIAEMIRQPIVLTAVDPPQTLSRQSNAAAPCGSLGPPCS